MATGILRFVQRRLIWRRAAYKSEYGILRYLLFLLDQRGIILIQRNCFELAHEDNYTVHPDSCYDFRNKADIAKIRSDGKYPIGGWPKFEVATCDYPLCNARPAAQEKFCTEPLGDAIGELKKGASSTKTSGASILMPHTYFLSIFYICYFLQFF